MWMKSKWSLGYVQDRFRSSISKAQFGGTKRGWIGERSVPTTWADGYASAISLGGSEQSKVEEGVFTLPKCQCQFLGRGCCEDYL